MVKHLSSIVVICLKNRTFAVSQTAKIGKEVVIKRLWFAWKIVLLQYHKQRCANHYYLTLGLWFAWKIVLLQYHKQLINLTNLSTLVVICLKNRTFAVSQTAFSLKESEPNPLWFAWKIVLLQYHKQHTFSMLKWTYRCDLLEKSYFCSITNSYKVIQQSANLVVICLKNRTFAVSQTA